MSDTTVVKEVVVKASNVTRITWFLAGVVVSAVMLYAVPSTGDLATNAVSSVITKAPGVADAVTTTVGGWIDSIGAAGE